MRVHAETVEAGALRRGVRVWLGGEWRTVTDAPIVRGGRVALRLDYEPWPSLSASRFVRATWVTS